MSSLPLVFVIRDIFNWFSAKQQIEGSAASKI